METHIFDAAIETLCLKINVPYLHNILFVFGETQTQNYLR